MKKEAMRTFESRLHVWASRRGPLKKTVSQGGIRRMGKTRRGIHMGKTKLAFYLLRAHYSTGGTRASASRPLGPLTLLRMAPSPISQGTEKCVNRKAKCLLGPHYNDISE